MLLLGAFGVKQVMSHFLAHMLQKHARVSLIGAARLTGEQQRLVSIDPDLEISKVCVALQRVLQGPVRKQIKDRPFRELIHALPVVGQQRLELRPSAIAYELDAWLLGFGIQTMAELNREGPKGLWAANKAVLAARRHDDHVAGPQRPAQI